MSKNLEHIAVHIGVRIQELRTKSGITQKYLSERIGVYQSVLCNIEHGTHCPAVDKLIAIADVLSCSLDYLIRGRDSERTATRRELDDSRREIERLKFALSEIAEKIREVTR
jgi:transcriptional regulator with XRE-family HTH domain